MTGAPTFLCKLIRLPLIAAVMVGVVWVTGVTAYAEYSTAMSANGEQ